MTSIDLLKKTQKDFVTNENSGVSESIIVQHKTLIEETRAFVGVDIQNKKDSDVRLSEIEFANVYLEENPKIDDKIIYEGETWEIYEQPKKQIGLWIIKCRKDARHSAGARRKV